MLLWTPSRRVGLAEKLLPRYTGPYCVLRQVTDVTYEIVSVSLTASSVPLSTFQDSSVTTLPLLWVLSGAEPALLTPGVMLHGTYQ